MQVNHNTVAACQTDNARYPEIAPFHPDTPYPEYTFTATSSEPNAVYTTVRNCFRAMKLDAANEGTPEWNPLRGLIRPGETVLLKPNLVKEFHPRDPEGWKYVLTHGSVIRAVADYVWKALEGRGRVVVADAPQTDSSFETIARLLGLNELRDFYQAQGLDFELVDLRKEEWVNRDGVIVERKTLAGDPHDYLAFDLGARSEFAGHRGELRYYGADYDSATLNAHHSQGRHEYLIAGSAIRCDVVFSLPKLKTHKKAGITVSLKNLIGINGDKNWLPHHTEGDPSNGGDEHPAPDGKHKAERALVPYFRRLTTNVPVLGPWLHRRARQVGSKVFGDTEEVIRSGNWWGNDTIWRTCLDLNKIVLYGNADGTLRADKPENRKRHFSLVDGLIAGAGRGPMNPDPINAGLIVFGTNPANVDAACAYLMGYDPELIPIVRQAFRCRHYPLTDRDWRELRLVSDRAEWNSLLSEIADHATYHFKPHFGWRGHIERQAQMENEDAESGKSLSQAAGRAAKSGVQS
jgi:uncharacterized protein (DUF362 family)